MRLRHISIDAPLGHMSMRLGLPGINHPIFALSVNFLSNFNRSTPRESATSPLMPSLVTCQWVLGCLALRRAIKLFAEHLKFPPSSGSRVCGFPAGREPSREIRPKITRHARRQLAVSWADAHIWASATPNYSWRRVRPKSPHANVKIGTGPRKRPSAACPLMKWRRLIWSVLDDLPK